MIDAKLLAKMFLAGAKNLEHKKEWINELNVFPVPDGDTGTNMSMTIMSAAKEVAAIAEPDMASLAKAISSGSLRGARGNSGVILSQLFRGFTKVISEYDEINVAILASACEKAVETAYKAVMKPKEGTILTVAKGAAKRANDLAVAGEKDLEVFISEVIKEAEYVLSQTPEMLPVLKQAGVVDSGGQGLVEVMKGAFDAFLGKELDLSIEAVPQASVNKSALTPNIEAQAQAEILNNIYDELTDKEKDIVRRGRNAENHHLPKNANVQDYMYATAFEALIGYLYLTSQNDRLKEILKKSLD